MQEVMLCMFFFFLGALVEGVCIMLYTKHLMKKWEKALDEPLIKPGDNSGTM